LDMYSSGYQKQQITTALQRDVGDENLNCPG
jgi:hypothetical protein